MPVSHSHQFLWVLVRSVITDIGNELSALLLDDWLVCRATLQVIEAHQRHISGFKRPPRDGLRRAISPAAQQHHSKVHNDGAEPLRHFDSYSAAGGRLSR